MIDLKPPTIAMPNGSYDMQWDTTQSLASIIASVGK